MRRCNLNVACSGSKATYIATALPLSPWVFTPIEGDTTARLVCCEACKQEIENRQNRAPSPLGNVP